jgi:hypothetical protein
MLTYEMIIKYLTPEKNPFSLKSNDLLNFTKLFDDNFFRANVENSSFKNCILYCFDLTELDNYSLTEIVSELNINIIIFDFKDNNIYSDYNGDFFNPWKPTLYLANYNEWWAPIVCKDNKIFSFSSPKSNILKNNILIQTILKYKTNDQIIINDNFSEIIDLEGFTNTSETFITKEKPSLNKLEKMKKAELLELCKELNKVIDTSKQTKKDLIEIICKD